MFFTDKKIAKVYYSFFRELLRNILFFLFFQTLVVLQSEIKILATSKELVFASFFCFFSILYLVFINLRGVLSDYNFEKINFFLFSINIAYVLAILLHLINIKFLLPILNMDNFHYANIFILSTVSFFIIILRYLNLKDYLVGAKSDIMLKNCAYKKLKLNYKAISKKSLKIDKSLSDCSVISHEVGHLMFILNRLNKDDNLIISIIPDLSAKGYVMTDILKNPKNKSEYQSKMMYYMGGLAAEYYEHSLNNKDLELGATSDLWNFSNLAASFFKNGFSPEMQFLNELNDLSIEQVTRHNKECMDYAYQTILKNCLTYLIINKNVYEEIKSLLKEEKVLYTEDLLKFKDQLQGEMKCDL